MSYDSVIAADSPAAWWKLADAAGSSTAADSSGNGWTGTPTAGVTFGSPSYAVPGDTSAVFSGTADVATAFNPAYAAGVSLEAWINFNGTFPAGNPRALANAHTDFSFAPDYAKGFELVAADSTHSGSPVAWFGNGTVAAGAVFGVALPASGWSHIVATWDGTTIRTYVNAVSYGIASLSGSLPAGSTGTALACNPAYAGDYLTGSLAECAVYSYVLTAAQIAAHYAAATLPGLLWAAVI